MREELKPCWTALMDYRQADEDGVMVLVSRQAIHECFDDYLKRGAELNRREPSVQEAALSQNDLYYLRAISRRLDEFQSAMDGLDALTIGGEALADERDWLGCFIDQHTRTIAEKDTPNDR